ncbi:MAG TPA: ABC transporter substrate-binding protein [bacterium]|nr:ABC transporter substrate-binding protein [bacterium]
MRGFAGSSLGVWAVVLVLLCLVGVGAATGQQPRKGGTLVVVLDTDPPTITTATTTSLSDEQVGVSMLDSLIWVDRSDQIRPHLAESWTVSPDGLAYTFHLRHDVKWHDGQPFTSADVKFSFEQILAKYHPRAAGSFVHVKSIETPDPYTVVARMQEPYAPFLHSLGMSDGPIVPKHLLEGTDIVKSGFLRRPVGTGPFKFQEWIPGDRIVVVRNTDYFEPGLPYLDRIIFKEIPDVHARAVALETGEADYVFDSFLGQSDVPQLARDKGIKLEYDTDFPLDDVLIFNVRKPPLSNVKVRQAITTAIARGVINHRVFFGLGAPGRSPIDSRFTWAYNPQADYQRLYAYNPAVAGRLLDEAGYPVKTNGMRFTIRHTFDIRRPGQLPLAQLLREQLRKVGIDLELDGVERSVMLDRIYNKWDFDTTTQLYNSNGDPAIGLQRLYICREIRKAPFTNGSGYCNPEVDQLFAKGASVVSQAERGTYYKQVQLILVRDVPTLVLNERRRVDAARIVVNGLWGTKIGYERLAPVWLSTP